MIELRVGNLYKLPHGIGKLLGSETFIPGSGKQGPISKDITSTYEYNRFIFEIDGACKWAKLMNSTKYACVRKDIQELE